MNHNDILLPIISSCFFRLVKLCHIQKISFRVSRAELLNGGVLGSRTPDVLLLKPMISIYSNYLTTSFWCINLNKTWILYKNMIPDICWPRTSQTKILYTYLSQLWDCYWYFLYPVSKLNPETETFVSWSHSLRPRLHFRGVGLKGWDWDWDSD